LGLEKLSALPIENNELALREGNLGIGSFPVLEVIVRIEKVFWVLYRAHCEGRKGLVS